MEVADISYLKEKIAALEAKYGKTNLSASIITAADRMKKKIPSMRKEVAIERAYSLIESQLSTSKGFKHYKQFIPIAISDGDWNFWDLKDMQDTWKKGDLMSREKLEMEGKIFVKDGKPVKEIIKSHKDENGNFVIDECTVIEDNDKTSFPVFRDYKTKMGKAPVRSEDKDERKDNKHFGFPLENNYHLEVIGMVLEDKADKVEPTLIQMRFSGDTADTVSQGEKFVGLTKWNQLFNTYDVRTRMIKEEDAIPIHSGEDSVWTGEKVDPEIDMKIFEAAARTKALKPMELGDMQEQYIKFFRTKDDKAARGCYGISEVTIKKIEEPTFDWQGQKLYVRDSSLKTDEDPDVQASLPKWVSVQLPVTPCQAIIVYWLKEVDGGYDKKTKKWDKNLTSLQPQVIGLKLVAGASLDEDLKEELAAAAGEE